MTEAMPDGILRTLIVTHGPLAQTVGENFSELLTAWNGPDMAMAVVTTIEEEAAMDTAVSQALTRISPPDLTAVLATQGWTLASATDISLILLVDVMPEGGEKAAALLAQTAAVIYRHLGIEASSLLIWLAGEAAETAGPELWVSCLAAPIHVTRGVSALGLCNEAGLRLPDEHMLCDLSAAILWCLTVTPLRHLPEQAVVQNSQLAGGVPQFSLGLAGWQWSPAATQAAFARRWLDEVLAHWLSAALEPTPPSEITAWLHNHHLRLEDFAANLLKEEEREPPSFPLEAWHMPWPWEISAILTDTLFAITVDAENLTAYQEYACLRLAEPLQRATSALQKQARTMLDEQPVAGIARACNWLQICLMECERLIEQSLDQEETIKENLAYMGGQQTQHERQLKQWLAVWPQARWQTWLSVGFRPWRWPGLAWRYRQWQHLGPQWSRLLQRQAILQRQLIINRASRQGFVELSQMTRRVYSQVEEVGQMLHFLAEEMTGVHPSPTAEPDAGTCSWPLMQLPLPAALYEQLVDSPADEAVMAASACGGLGQQVNELDEKIGIALQNLATKRMRGVWQLTAVDAFLSSVKDADEIQAHWQAATQVARPLWRLDETRLDEITRAQNGRMTALCGPSAPALVHLWAQPAEEFVCWESTDRERLWLVRLRAGLG